MYLWHDNLLELEKPICFVFQNKISKWTNEDGHSSYVLSELQIYFVFLTKWLMCMLLDACYFQGMYLLKKYVCVSL